MIRSIILKSDWVLLGVVLVLIAFGVAMVYSCTHLETRHGAPRWALQIAWIAIGLVALILMGAFDYVRLQPLAPTLYGIALTLMAVVLVFARHVRGAQRWIPLGPFHLQPTEIAKIAAVVMLAAYLAGREDKPLDLRTAVTSLALLFPAMALALLQPDMGTPVVLFGAWLCMLFVAGGQPVHLVGITATLVWAFAAAWATNLIKPHQKQRLPAFLNPEADPQGAGWQVKQALVAVGSGRFFGQGYLRGTQTQLNFIPDQEADFIFTAIAEELGFLGSLVALGLLAVVLYRGLSIAAAARDTFGRLLAAGFVGILATHIVVNVGMTLGLAPVKGMPLPFLSYGGSNMVACMIIVGLLNSIHLRRRRIDFDL
jgi:rod shape determining protein RodA